MYLYLVIGSIFVFVYFFVGIGFLLLGIGGWKVEFLVLMWYLSLVIELWKILKCCVIDGIGYCFLLY